MYRFYTFFFDLLASQTGAYMDTFCWNSCTGLAAVPAPCVHFFAASCWPGKGAFPRRYRWEYVLFVVYIIRRISSEKEKGTHVLSVVFPAAACQDWLNSKKQLPDLERIREAKRNYTGSR